MYVITISQLRASLHLEILCSMALKLLSQGLKNTGANTPSLSPTFNCDFPWFLEAERDMVINGQTTSFRDGWMSEIGAVRAFTLDLDLTLFPCDNSSVPVIR
eukprot:CAMPEP_0184704530 /NCGR_PEP_ID=MMETSP0313-20130426/31479_1 /TAXON_ID=2792 /ORGANISM="Porphyridium aerugineum, Strain SAG 1380-2" /LENGTH=101 /DNA_ID=CAMNT_0027165607 /DNA_START=747 /DNA_END=1048 /DNA_ORIENTATION=-